MSLLQFRKVGQDAAAHPVEASRRPSKVRVACRSAAPAIIIATLRLGFDGEMRAGRATLAGRQMKMRLALKPGR